MELLSILEYVTENKNSAFFYTPVKDEKSVSYFFKVPEKCIKIIRPDEIQESFFAIQNEINAKKNGFCLIPYETGYLFEERLQKFANAVSHIPLFDFYFFDENNFLEFKSTEISFASIKEFATNTSFQIRNFRLNTPEEEYKNAIGKIKNYIEEGDTYQVNFTVKGKFSFKGDIKKLFYDLIYNQSAEYSAIINLGDRIVLSVSPELFFEIHNKTITVKPMKGTTKRAFPNDADQLVKTKLQNDDKNRAENVMIVDLLRNDLGRICKYNSVKTLSLFDVHTYETLHQMTSTVTGELTTNNIYEILKNIFPSGSITGAPKIRTMRIINELEKETRGYYTGTIGLFSNGRQAFNIPIRTIVLQNNEQGEIGIGSGIVWDSDPDEEFAETLLKSNFLIKPVDNFEIFETMLYENGEVFLFDYHVKRLSESAEYFLFRFNRSHIEKTMLETIEKLEGSKKYRLKIILDKWGDVKVGFSEFSGKSNGIKITIHPDKMDQDNKYLYFKTTNRKVYDQALEKAIQNGYDEIVFMNKKEEITEGSISNIFILKNGEWYTPPVESGLLDGCYRQYLLKQFPNHCVKKLYLPDLLECEAVKCVNSLRKEMRVNEIYFNGNLLKKFD